MPKKVNAVASDHHRTENALPVRSLGESQPARLNAHTVAPAQPITTAAKIRDIMSIAAGGEAPAAYVLPTDTKATVAKKALGVTFAAVNLHNFHARLGIGRVAKACGEISKQAGTTGWYDKADFDIGTRPFVAIHGAVSTVTFLKRGYDIAYDVAADISRHQDRQELQRLIKSYDPATGGFIREGGSGKLFYNAHSIARIKEIATTQSSWKRTGDGGNPWRTNRQRAFDIISRGRDNSTSMLSGGIPNLVALAAPVGVASTVLNAAGGLAAVGHAVGAINSFTKAGTHCTAINNIEAARVQAKTTLKQYKLEPGSVKAVATNQVLLGLSNRMIQERTYQARLHFWHGASFTFSAIANAIGIAGTGVTGVSLAVTQLVSFIAIFASGTAQVAFNIVHGRTLAKRRDTAARSFNRISEMLTRLPEGAKQRYFATLDKNSQIGMLERFTLAALRGNSRADAQAAYDFLSQCGIASNTIKALMLHPSADTALAMMQKQLYTERTKFIAKNLKYTAKTAGYLTGISYANRAVKAYKEKRANAQDYSKLAALSYVVTPPPAKDKPVASIMLDVERDANLPVTPAPSLEDLAPPLATDV